MNKDDLVGSKETLANVLRKFYACRSKKERRRTLFGTKLYKRMINLADQLFASAFGIGK
jgi:hypothetical protein